LKKGDSGKVLVAVLLRKHTSVGNQWLVHRLAMGHPSALSRLLGSFQASKGSMNQLMKMERMLR
jgi:hypothetical protein